MKKLYIGLMAFTMPLLASAQETFDALQMSQTELRGTSRFQSMAGAFGALGGDISTLNQNPAGVGVYRSSDATSRLAWTSTAAKLLPSPTIKPNSMRSRWVMWVQLSSTTTLCQTSMWALAIIA